MRIEFVFRDVNESIVRSGDAVLYHGDCLDVVTSLPLVDSVVCDPPYGLSFMGADWDHRTPGVEFWAAIGASMKPGAYLLAFGGTRTYHRLACAIEDSGFEIRDCVVWVYGSGFPKSLNLGKSMAKSGISDSKQWDGWGTALKPAWEPIVVARKPLSQKTVVANVLKYGTGGINIDACRVGTTKEVPVSPRRAKQGASYGDLSNCKMSDSGFDPNIGRWPANFIHDGGSEVMDTFSIGDHNGMDAARFFYCAKATKKERGAGNVHPTVKPQSLMRYLVRLVTPFGGIVLDPFMGSGSTLLAARNEGLSSIGIELSREYFNIAVERLR